tara:strand:+ start:265 stop:564 length:300 start_codon:yes stop_codon:yes gene_type:complete
MGKTHNKQRQSDSQRWALEVSMNYTDGTQAEVGDRVLIGGQYHGVVVADIDGDEYSRNYAGDQWRNLDSGVMIDTDFGGLVHYDQSSLDGELMELQQRA